jgi:hypothetical protein|tara:strand:- start:9 stop:197 length:189 start_codon:yes stop_codon:yes gene_type:complete
MGGIILLAPFVVAAVIIFLHYKGNKKIVEFFETEKGYKVRFTFWIYFWLIVIILTLNEAKFI